MYNNNNKFMKVLYNVYFSPSINKMMNSRRTRWTGHAYRILMGKPEGKTTRKT
jgi:hypothetical protein